MASVANGLFGTGTKAPSVVRSPDTPSIGVAVDSTPNPILHPVDALSSYVSSTLFSSRVIAIILGLIFITGAILLYIGDDVAGAISSGKGLAGKAGALVA